MDPGLAAAIASIIVASISLWSSRASAKAARTAKTKDIESSGRLKMEDAAYERARAMDTETINRLEEDNRELREDHTKLQVQHRSLNRKYDNLESKYDGLHDDFEALRIQNSILRERIGKLEQKEAQDG